jgi:hypothetical protein
VPKSTTDDARQRAIRSYLGGLVVAVLVAILPLAEAGAGTSAGRWPGGRVRQRAAVAGAGGRGVVRDAAPGAAGMTGPQGSPPVVGLGVDQVDYWPGDAVVATPTYSDPDTRVEPPMESDGTGPLGEAVHIVEQRWHTDTPDAVWFWASAPDQVIGRGVLPLQDPSAGASRTRWCCGSPTGSASWARRGYRSRWPACSSG